MKNLLPLVILAVAINCRAADLSGTISYTGSRTGPVHVTARQTLPGNKVLSLDGSGDTVQIPSLTSLAGSEISVQFWFRGASLQSAVRQQGSGWVIAGWNGQHILQNDGFLTGVAAGDGITDGNWHHVMFTWKQNTVDGFASYLDGRLVQKRESANAPIPNYDAAVYLGSFNNAGEYTSGQMDAVAIWNRSLTPEEVSANWYKALAGNEPGLVAYWDFDDSTFNDKTANAHHGTPFGDATVVDADIPGFNGGNAMVQVAGAGSYSILGLPTGTGYAVSAFMDVNGNGSRDAGEPRGNYSGNPFDLSADKTGVDMELRELPYITSHPSGARAASGGNTTFGVTALGSGPLAYQWFQNDTALTDGGRISGAKSPNLQVTGLVSGDAGGYSCKVSNDVGVATSLAAQLDVVVNGKTIAGTFMYAGSETGKVHTTVAQLRSNKVLNLDGVNDYAITTLTDLSGDELTIEYWFKGQTVWSAVRQQGGGDYIVAGWGDNYHILSNDGGVGQPMKISDPLTKVVDGNWHHVAMAWKRNTMNGFATYFDGELVAQRDSANTSIPYIGSQVFFGSWSGAGEFAKGQLDEIAIWSRALTRAEVRSHARSGLTGTEPNLRGYWNFDDGLGQDLSPNGNHADLREGAAIVDAAIPGLGASYSDVFAGVGAFQISDIPAGNGYSLLAYLDANGNGTQDPSDPCSAYAGNPFDLTANLNGIEVVLYDTPVVRTNPMTVTVLEGQTIHLDAVVGGTSNALQWLHHGTPLTDGGRVAGAQSAQLTITAARLADAGAYSLAASNLVGTVTSQPAAVIVQPTSITNILLGHWKFDETTGTLADEDTGLSQDAFLSNFPGDDSQWVAGQIGRAIAFGHPTNLQYALASDYVKPTNTMSMSAWVWAESRPTWASIAKNWGGNQAGQFHFGLTGGSGELSTYVTDGSGSAVSAGEAVPLPLGSWQHVAFVADGARVRLYRNGAEVAVSAPYNGSLLTPPMAALGIGVKTDDFGSGPDATTPGYWHGKLDDLALWGRALSPAELLGIYQAGLAGKNVTQAVAVQSVRLSVSQAGGQITISYDAGVLESAPEVTGPWNPVSGAAPPSYQTPASGERKFFRVQ